MDDEDLEGAYLTAVEAVLRSAVDAVAAQARAASPDPALDSLVAQFHAATTGGGKRLRPLLCRWGNVAAGGDVGAGVVAAGAAIELVHVCAIVHDDVIDASPLRRGIPTAHERFASGHAESRWRGDAGRFGTSAAILLGDLALVIADAVLATAGVAGAPPGAAFTEYTAMRTEVLLGQYLDLVGGLRRLDDGATAAERALEIAMLKTASYTVVRPLLVGAALQGDAALEAARAPLTAYGRAVGLAFQLRDDLLGAFGDEDITGKELGTDFREGKQTYLVARAIELGDAEIRACIEEHLGAPELDHAGIVELQAALEASGAVADTEKRIDELVADGCAALEGAGDVSAAARAGLTALARRMAYRAF